MSCKAQLLDKELMDVKCSMQTGIPIKANFTSFRSRERNIIQVHPNDMDHVFLQIVLYLRLAKALPKQH